MKLLLVEDDERVAEALVEYLSDQNYLVDVAHDGQEGWELGEAYNYDLILLDVMLPKLDGVTVCQRLRNAGCGTPILMLTARDTNNDKIAGLDAGADDYVVKPFDLEVLSARVRALLRRSTQSLSPILSWGELTLDSNGCKVTYQQKPLALTPKEYRLLELFLRNERRVFSRSTILELLWSWEELPTEATVKTHIKSLRSKLKTAGAPSDLIETVHGLGYRLKEIS
ncbi:MAG: response regulator transcription factor [Jaaginema sp. PMC 1079.18]|nr:response regulator transcription factor [Jaaginema sp. PMC 1080.18]MEC4852359.1 response regulator transcription factor [Jaaginema sp. PMC 1079.18]MEC4868873.1 response regulator transcription factor [Jaaginema sp. PMC 1078.18]